MLNFKQYNFKGKVFHIDPIVRGYNLAMVAVNFYIAYELYANTIGHYNWACEPVDTTVNPRSMRIASAIYLFWFSKLIELLDSVFFILRGKYNQGLRSSVGNEIIVLSQFPNRFLTSFHILTNA